MRAAVFYEVGKPLVVEDVELEAPRAGEVRVRIAATGVCRSDLHYIKGDLTMPTPVVLGHEAAGVVEELGTGVDSVRTGDHVVLLFAPACGHCRYCACGRPHLCEMRSRVRGKMPDGTTRLRVRGRDVHHFTCVSSWAEEAVVPASGVLPIDRDISFGVAALLGCAVTTGVGAVVNTAQVPAGARVAVFGLGGVAVAVGLPPTNEDLAVPGLPFVLGEKTLRACFYGSSRLRFDIPRLLALYGTGRLMLDELVTAAFPLDRVNEAVATLDRGDGLRSILDMSAAR